MEPVTCRLRKFFLLEKGLDPPDGDGALAGRLNGEGEEERHGEPDGIVQARRDEGVRGRQDVAAGHEWRQHGHHDQLGRDDEEAEVERAIVRAATDHADLVPGKEKRGRLTIYKS